MLSTSSSSLQSQKKAKKKNFIRVIGAMNKIFNANPSTHNQAARRKCFVREECARDNDERGMRRKTRNSSESSYTVIGLVMVLMTPPHDATIYSFIRLYTYKAASEPHTKDETSSSFWRTLFMDSKVKF